MMVWAVSLLATELSPRSLTPDITIMAFGVCLDTVGKTIRIHSVLYLHNLLIGAIPKYISGRTSYYQARLAFHFLPQVVP